MLLLALHAHETLVLETRDGPIELRLHMLDGAQARIGVDAPSAVRVVRHSVAGEAGETAETGAETGTDIGAQAAVTPDTARHDPLDADGMPWWQHPDEAVES